MWEILEASIFPETYFLTWRWSQMGFQKNAVGAMRSLLGLDM